MGVVIRTGVKTVIGQIAALTTGQPPKKSRLEKQIKFFVHFLLILAPAVGTISMIVGGLTFGWGNWILLLSTSYAVCAIALVPEGLSATVTSILTVVARRLEKKSVYLKRLDIAEALGSAKIIASDKTGTLTKNVMTVTDMWIDDLVIHGFPRLDDHTLRELKTLETFKPPISDILLAMAVCNKADFDYDKDVKIDINEKFTMTLNRDQSSIAAKAKQAPAFARLNSQDGATRTTHRSIYSTILPFSSFGEFLRYRNLVSKRPALGAASDVAMLKYAAQVIDVGKSRRTNPVVFEIPFNSKRKWQLVIIKKRILANNQAKYKLIMKGASDILIKKCDKIMNMNEEEVPLDENERAKFERAVETFGEQGRRVIGFAQVEFVEAGNFTFNEKAGNYPQEGLIFLGTCAIMDPPRDETADAIKSCKDAGIRIFMVTGDPHTTAKAIAEQIGLIDEKPANQSNWEIGKGEDIPKLTHRDWGRLAARKSLVFSRTTPEQKLLIVEEMQKRKQVIAMTGDGVNDSPALKKADIGVGMGSGGEVAKQAADIILMNDNFASIGASIKEGRLMFENIKKLMAYVMPHAITELWGIWIYYLFGMPVATNSLIVLSMDLGTEIPPGIAMCNEPFESDIMERPPRQNGKNIVSKALLFYTYGYLGFLQAIACFLSYCYIFWSHGINISDLWMSALDHWKADGTNFTSNGHTFTVDEQLYINRQAVSAWQVGIVFGQMFHLFSARSLRESMFKHGFFSNKSAIIAVVLEFIMLMVFVYVPGINEFLGGAPVPVWCWVIVAVYSIGIFFFNEIRKYCIRRWPKNPIVRIFKF
ncbi:hypothetical protein WR25_24339 isoform C [Diploscapter pachys]|uniref:Cation-transporting P-type ATPase C-terminal domain-containing protein n=1 Tax=Diploscapter pachys TaxID=2018661 RepID=A0A2A2KBP9_9BILA|nr:hypothetical protein WR25_24339 isoform A [Diploscapter pachys]PAV71366.1 hypothetical protein WR25_24339 isoform B [Diploscapter pachys]PAV71367.1 hypothetical protein WR25_24339 isoform C [Diploscapter pachys]